MTVRVEVAGLPPAATEGESLLGEQAPHAERVRALLEAAKVADLGDWDRSTGAELELDVIVRSPERPPSDATSYLVGISTALADKGNRTDLAHLGDLATVSLYADDTHIQEVHYQWVRATTLRYTVTLKLR